jgi:hypothetical protein
MPVLVCIDSRTSNINFAWLARWRWEPISHSKCLAGVTSVLLRANAKNSENDVIWVTNVHSQISFVLFVLFFYRIGSVGEENNFGAVSEISIQEIERGGRA